MVFDTWVGRLLDQVGPGSVTTFGDIAAALGDPLAARAVGRRIFLQRHGYRVVYADGTVPEAHVRALSLEVPVEGGKAVAERADLTYPGTPPLLELRNEQKKMAGKVRLEHCGGAVEGGFDVAFRDDTAVGALVTREKTFTGECLPGIPYIPTYLAFREAPLFSRIAKDAAHSGPVLIDGNGILHPRRFGTACMAGVLAGVPTVGVAKSLLCGEVRGDKVFLDGEHVGWALRASGRVKNPVYVSPGHLVDLDSCRRLVEDDLVHRIPRLIGMAHNAAGESARRIRPSR